MSCGVGCGHGSDLALLWLRCRLAAIALIGETSIGCMDKQYKKTTIKITKRRSLVAQQVKDPALSLQWFMSLLCRGFSPWPAKFSMLWVWPNFFLVKSVIRVYMFKDM